MATENKNNIVYWLSKIDCVDCIAVYFSKSKLSLKSRSDEHEKSVKNWDSSKSETAKHCTIGKNITTLAGIKRNLLIGKAG